MAVNTAPMNWNTWGGAAICLRFAVKAVQLADCSNGVEHSSHRYLFTF